MEFTNQLMQEKLAREVKSGRVRRLISEYVFSLAEQRRREEQEQTKSKIRYVELITHLNKGRNYAESLDPLERSSK